MRTSCSLMPPAGPACVLQPFGGQGWFRHAVGYAGYCLSLVQYKLRTFCVLKVNSLKLVSYANRGEGAGTSQGGYEEDEEDDEDEVWKQRV